MKSTRTTYKITPRKKSVSARKKSTAIYEQDFYQWTKQQVDFLKKRDLSHLDVENLIEEIESLGRTERRSLKSYFIILLQHLLKIKYQPDCISNSWNGSVSNSKREIELLLEDSPSLKKELSQIKETAYTYAREKASQETGLPLDLFPEECPWTTVELFPRPKKK